MKKVVKVDIYDSVSGYYWRTIFNNVRMASYNDYTISQSAIRHARQFFKKLGYDVEIVK